MVAVVTTQCEHGTVCLLNAGRALHPLLLDPCESAVVGEDGRDAAADVMLTNHYVVRDGSVWKCVHCGRTEPFGKLTEWGETCTPRRWGDQ